MPLTVDLLNPKSIGFDIVSRTMTVQSFKLHVLQSGFLFYRPSIHTHTHTHHHKVITISAPLYYVVVVDEVVQ